jgi:prolyl oligopeptidase
MSDSADRSAFTTPSVAFVIYESYLQPTSLFAVDVAARRARLLTSIPAQFDASRYRTEQYWTVSKDGTRVPYFLIRRRSFQANGKAPTLMHGYGAAGALMTPRYDGLRGRLWLEHGGVYVEANIRGGGEFGPDWHVTGVNRLHTYEDFIAVAQDLIRRKITSAKHLGIRGHSMGGLLVGVTLTLRPELFNAAIIENPQDLDLIYAMMKFPDRATEFGSINIPKVRAFLERISPYHNLKRRDGFPAPLVKTSTNDAATMVFGPRKYVAKLASLDMPYFYYESPEGGHSCGVTPQQVALCQALVYTYLAERLMDRHPATKAK